MQRVTLKDEEEMLDLNSEEIAKEQKQRSLQRVNTAAGIVGIADMLDIAGIFAMHLKDNWRTILTQTARYPMFMLAAVFGFIAAGLSIHKASLLDGKKGSTELAIIKSLSAMFIGTAVGFALFGPSELAEFAAPIFAGVLGFQGILNGVKALVEGIKANKTSDPDKNQAHHEQARGNGIGMLVGLAITVAVVGVMILKHNDVAYVGVGAGLVGAGYTARQMAKSKSKTRSGYTQVSSDDVPLELEESKELRNSSTFSMKKEMSRSKQHVNSESPYQPIPDLSDIKTESAKSSGNVIQLPSVADITLGAIQSANDVRKKKTGTDSQTVGEELHRTDSSSLGYKKHSGSN